MGGRGPRCLAPRDRHDPVPGCRARHLVLREPHRAGRRLGQRVDGRQAGRDADGRLPRPDVGTVRVRTLPNFWNHSSCDHGVSTRLLPAGPRKTLARVTWLVHEDAVEGRDYELDKLMPFWQLTSEQDWAICERQQRGVDSTAYAPGPTRSYKEYNVDAFVSWYVKTWRPGRAPERRNRHHRRRGDRLLDRLPPRQGFRRKASCCSKKPS